MKHRGVVLVCFLLMAVLVINIGCSKEKLPGYGGTVQKGTLEVTLWGVGVWEKSWIDEEIIATNVVIKNIGERAIDTVDFFILQDDVVLKHHQYDGLPVGKSEELLLPFPEDVPLDCSLTLAFESGSSRVEFELAPLETLVIRN